MPEVRDNLRAIMQATSNTHTLIMHERIAPLMLSLSAGQWVGSKHGDLEYA